jgi:RNA recognition motif-containing protein
MSSAVDNLADNLASASVQDPNSTAQDTLPASATEGRRLYIGNLAYATAEGELKEFFKDYKV